MFYLGNGWSFDRNASDGSVSIFKADENAASDAPQAPVVTIGRESWASVVASVSAEGEENGRFYEALKFHGEPKPMPVEEAMA